MKNKKDIIAQVHDRIKHLNELQTFKKAGNHYYEQQRYFSKALLIEYLSTISDEDTYCYSVSIGYGIPEYLYILKSGAKPRSLLPKDGECLLAKEYNHVKRPSDSSPSFYEFGGSHSSTEMDRFCKDLTEIWLPQLNLIASVEALIEELLKEESFYIDKMMASILLVNTGHLERAFPIFKENFESTNSHWRERIERAAQQADLPSFQLIRNWLKEGLVIKH